MEILSPYKIAIRVESITGYASEENDSGDEVLNRIRREENDEEIFVDFDVSSIDAIRTKRGRKPKGKNTQYEILLKSGGAILIHSSEDVEAIKDFWIEATEENITDETTNN